MMTPAGGSASGLKRGQYDVMKGTSIDDGVRDDASKQEVMMERSAAVDHGQDCPTESAHAFHQKPRTSSKPSAGATRRRQRPSLAKEKAGRRRLPKRGDVKKKIGKDIVRMLIGGAKYLQGGCANPSRVADPADSFLQAAPFPTKREAMAKLWPKVDIS